MDDDVSAQLPASNSSTSETGANLGNASQDCMPNAQVSTGRIVPDYFAKLKFILTSPRDFFVTVQNESGLRQAAIFLAITVGISAIGAGLFGKGLVHVPKIFMLAVLGNYVSALFWFLLFKLFGGKGSLPHSVRVMNYSLAPAVFAFIPLLRWPANLYSSYLVFLGLRTAHQVSTLKAALLVFIPTAMFFIAMRILEFAGKLFGH